MADVLRDRLTRLGVPVLGGLPAGHGPHPPTIPLGTQATIDTAAGNPDGSASRRLTVDCLARPAGTTAVDGCPVFHRVWLRARIDSRYRRPR
ncbi:hypothetical protein [Streptomyces sp. NL15-2K]|uniref:hypothetical protein n=1 Tax=Streptomyces sp. NL15-2K TaxID=376149 RepID=UPI00155A683E